MAQNLVTHGQFYPLSSKIIEKRVEDSTDQAEYACIGVLSLVAFLANGPNAIVTLLMTNTGVCGCIGGAVPSQFDLTCRIAPVTVVSIAI
jgi:hypothetical protein